MEHAVRCRLKDMDVDVSELIAVMEEVVEMIGLNRRQKTVPVPLKDDKTNGTIIRIANCSTRVENHGRIPVTTECYNCEGNGHRKLDCPTPRKRINNISLRDDENNQSHFDIIGIEPEEYHGEGREMTSP
jgi:hypothetical protein